MQWTYRTNWQEVYERLFLSLNLNKSVEHGFFVQISHKTVKRNTLTHLVNCKKLD